MSFGIGAVALVGIAAAGAGAVMTSNAKSKVQDPKQSTQQYNETAADVQAGMIANAPAQYAADATYAPLYAQMYNDIYKNQLLGNNGLVDTLKQASPQLQDLQSQLDKQKLQSNLSNVQTYGADALKAFQNINPQLQGIQNQQVNLAMNAPQAGMLQTGNQPGLINSQYMNQNVQAGQNQSLGMYNQMAQQQMAKGGQLSDQETNSIIQGVMGNVNQAGRANDPTAIAQAALGLDSASQARLAQNMGYGQNASTMTNQYNQLDLSGQTANQSARQALNQTSLTADAQNQQMLMQYLGYGADVGKANQAAQLQNANLQAQLLGQAQSSLMSPTMTALGMMYDPSNAIGQASSAYGTSAQSQTTGSGSYNPYGVATNLYDNYYNAQASANIQSANNKAAVGTGLINIGGSLLGGAIGGK